MKKIFISQPMRNKTQEEIVNARNAALATIKTNYNDDATILQSYKAEFKDLDPIACLGESLKIMSEADLVVFIGDWASARGCKIEHDVAVNYGKEVIELNELGK